MCCVDLAEPEGWGSLASLLPSPVGFDSFNITHQILSQADTKDLKTRETQNIRPRDGKVKNTEQAAVMRGSARCCLLRPLGASVDRKSKLRL